MINNNNSQLTCTLCRCLFPKFNLTEIQPRPIDEFGKSIHLCRKCITQTLRTIIDKLF